jgi:type IV pilus assembly protein PilN
VSVEKKDNLISLEGVTESNNRVSSFMRNFDESPWFEEANLNSVDALPEISETASSFSMTVKSAAPEKAGGES